MNTIQATLRKLAGVNCRYLHSSLSVLLLCGAVGATGARAQEGEGAAPVLEEVVVTGIRGSLREALDTRRFSNAIVDAINAEDLGKFPDKNVADSLSRITGVSVTRGFGEGEKIAVRGTSPDQNRTLLNGAAVASADWFVLDNPSRAFNYTLLPSNIVSSLEVYKTPRADLQEGSLGGTVVLRTRRPFDMEANSGTLQVQGMYSETSEEFDPLLSGLYSWKNEGETLGFNISLTKQDRSVLRKGTEILGFEYQDFGRGSMWTPRALGDAYFSQERERETGLFTGQWRPTDQGEFTLTYLDSQLDANNLNHNNYQWLNGQAGGGTIDPATARVEGGGVVAGQVADNYAEYYVIDRESYSETESLDLEYRHNFERMSVTARLGHTEAEGGTSSDKQYGFDTFLSGTVFSGLDATPHVDGSPETEAQLLGRGLGWMMENRRIMTDEEDYAGLDFEFDTDLGVFHSFKTGVMYRDHDKGQDQTGVRFHWLTDDMHSPDAQAYGEGDQSGWDRWLYGKLDAGTLGDYAYSESGAPYPLLNIGRASAVIFPEEAYANAATIQFLPNTWDVNEKIYAGYFSGEFEGEGFRGNIGLRVVQTDVDSTGYNWSGDWLAASIDMLGNHDLLVDTIDTRENFNVRQVTESHDYTEVLPNLNVAFDLDEDTVLRFSAARVMARPDYIEIANQESANLDTATGSRGNPFLDPEVADQFDLAYEWYFAEDSLLAVTYFQKDISNSLVSSTTVEERYETRTDEWVPVTFIQPNNGKGVDVAGVEVGYQQAFGNFGVIANYTYTDAESRDERDPVSKPGSGLVPGSSEHMANLTGYFENDWLSARLSYNYRSEWYDGVSEFGSEMYIDDYGQLDASITFTVWEDLDLVLEGINLTDEELEHFHIDSGRKARLYENGARYVVGVNYRF